MKLWTIQTLAAYEKFKDTGILRADETFIYEDMLFHYKWIADQMKKRIGSPPLKEIKYPIWLWYQWNGTSKKKPDLRNSSHLPKGTSGVRIELEVDSKDILLSDFEDFNGVLNYGYITETEVEYDNFYKELESYGFCHADLQGTAATSVILDQFKTKLYKSWEKIFDTEGIIVDESWSGKKEEQSIQATLWEVKWEQVISCKKFVSR